MFPQDAVTWVLYILLTVALGALGSGFWETVFKPSFVRIGRFLLKVVTLGMSSARDALYKDMAVRPTYKPAVFLVALVSFAFMLFLGTVTGYYYRDYFKAPEYVDIAHYESKIKDMSLEELQKEKERLGIQQHGLKKKLGLILFTVSLIGFVVTTLVHVRYRYLSTAIAHFDQLMAICAPYLSTEEEKTLRSAFAQMTCRNDYVTIIEKLKDHAIKHGVDTLPAFMLF
jgi:hypothetical protein